ncbi:protealysin inhibitor emfourin [Streptomyces sp. 796.1]|uniref:protealysin inhibitor emfourin n=1 Tax=Streptomyces sp. 796.1 TaxID=3163029 RepID=UPI0039C917B3
MRITVTRTGGFAGITRRAELESAGRPDAARLEELARAALGEGSRSAPVGVADGFQYRIEVDGAPVYCADPKLTEGLRELIRTVLKEGA